MKKIIKVIRETEPVKSTKEIAMEIGKRMDDVCTLYCKGKLNNNSIVHDMVLNIASVAMALSEIDELQNQPGMHSEKVSEYMNIAKLYLDLLENNAKARQQEFTDGSTKGWEAAEIARQNGKSQHEAYVKVVLKEFRYL